MSTDGGTTVTTLQEQARALGDPTRHAVFRYVADAGRPVDVAELTAHFRLNHNAIRQHLAKLLDAGLVEQTTVATGARGRPRLTYRVDPSVDSRWGVVGPYERLSVLLTEVLRTGDTPVEVGRRFAHRQERSGATAAAVDLADPLGAVVEVMAREGFDPEVRRRGDRVDVVLRTCPFASAALTDPSTVCALHLGIAEGVAELTGGRLAVDDLVARDPRRAGCLLQVHVEEPTVL